MPKLPKKTTMIETIDRVIGYTHKLQMKGQMLPKKMAVILNALNELKKIVDK